MTNPDTLPPTPLASTTSPETANPKTAPPSDVNTVAASRKRQYRQRTLFYGLGATVLATTSLVTWILSGQLLWTGASLAIALVGAMYYSFLRKRASNEGIICYSHSQLYYYWPIWLTSFIMADVSRFIMGDPLRLSGGGQEILIPNSPSLGLIYLTIVLVVLTLTAVNLRGVWAILVAVVAITFCLLFSVLDWWTSVLSFFGDLQLFINEDFYVAMGIGLFIPWTIVVFFFDIRRFIQIEPAQVTIVHEIGEGEKNFDSIGVFLEKRRDNFFQHHVLGFGSGDLVIKTSGGQAEVIYFPNVLRVGHVVRQLHEIREKRGRL